MSHQSTPILSSRDEFLQHARDTTRRFLGELRAKGRFYRIEYVRDPGIPTGVVAKGESKMGRGEPNAVLLAYEDDNGIRLGWAARHPSRERKPFNKAEGVFKAMRRAVVSSDQVPPERLCSPYRKFLAEVLEAAAKRRARDTGVLINATIGG